MPDSPDRQDSDLYYLNSDDLVQTSDVGYSPADHTPRALVIVGSREKTITLGRGGASTVKIGRRNRQISRIHVSIEHNPTKDSFELVVLGLNGATVDNVLYGQHERAELSQDSMIDVLGDIILFKEPPPLCEAGDEEEVMEEEEHMYEEEEEKPVNQKISRKFLIEEDEDEDEEDEEKNVVQNTRRQRQRPRQEEDEESDDDEEAEVKAEEDKKEEKQCVEKETDYSEIIIDALVFSRKSSMPMSDICSRIMKTNPTYRQQPRELWMSRIQHVLQICPFFGEIVRKGKTADGSPKENLYYYSSDKDPVEWRRTAYTQVGRSARKCTLQDKQYFWRIPPKLGRHRGTYIPPPAKDYYEPNNTSKRTNKSEEAEENSRKKSKHNSTN
ncbi:hypothetical protein J3Q64DRAFT_1655599 [Phycomyces blakesleeanus]|uniref:FHA domain-containing protein n=1 Tax=Phycomyces blakesleeanus TaxID=4837 RepID=A0ABR3B9W4_PHYBL